MSCNYKHKEGCEFNPDTHSQQKPRYDEVGQRLSILYGVTIIALFVSLILGFILWMAQRGWHT